MSRKIILLLSKILSKVSESILFAFFLRVDYIRSNRPAYVAVKKRRKKKSASCLCTVDGMFFSLCCFWKEFYADVHSSLILVSGDCFDFP